MKSMTGYGGAASEGGRAKVTVQVRSVNHRHLDIQLRVPREYLSLEEDIRKAIRRRISRGRLDVFVERTPLKGSGRRLELDEDLLRQYLASLGRVKRRFGLEGEVDVATCAGFPELFRLREAGVEGEDERGLVLKTLEAALRKLERSREREGRQLRSDVLAQVRHLRKISAGLARESEVISSRIREPSAAREETENGERLRETEPSAANFKGDIHEEAVRLKTHVEELGRLINGRGSIGKQIDFLLQEVQRELNTIGSKAPQLGVIQMVLAGKEKAEKIREQAQNVE